MTTTLIFTYELTDVLNAMLRDPVCIWGQPVQAARGNVADLCYDNPLPEVMPDDYCFRFQRDGWQMDVTGSFGGRMNYCFGSGTGPGRKYVAIHAQHYAPGKDTLERYPEHYEVIIRGEKYTNHNGVEKTIYHRLEWTPGVNAGEYASSDWICPWHYVTFPFGSPNRKHQFLEQLPEWLHPA